MVWCRKEELYNTDFVNEIVEGLWFDVEKKNYTTVQLIDELGGRLWFDVEKKNYTTKLN